MTAGLVDALRYRAAVMAGLPEVDADSDGAASKALVARPLGMKRKLNSAGTLQRDYVGPWRTGTLLTTGRDLEIGDPTNGGDFVRPEGEK